MIVDAGKQKKELKKTIYGRINPRKPFANSVQPELLLKKFLG